MTLVSVILPVHNRRMLALTAIESVLSQTHPHVQLIVVDDGSDDGSADLIAQHHEPQLQLIRLPTNVGRSTARNIGWAAARGELVAFLDSDDVWLPDKLTRQIPCFDDPEVQLVHCRPSVIDANGSAMPAESRALSRAFDDADQRGYDYGGITATWCRMYTSAVMVRRTTLERTGGFDPALMHFEDWDLFWRIARLGRVMSLPDVLLQYRQHAGNSTLPWAEAADPWLRVMQKHLALLPTADVSPALREARHNLLLNMSLGEYWRGDLAASRRWMLRALAASRRPLRRPGHPVWGTPLLHALLPHVIARRLVDLVGCDAYRNAAHSASRHTT